MIDLRSTVAFSSSIFIPCRCLIGRNLRFFPNAIQPAKRRFSMITQCCIDLSELRPKFEPFGAVERTLHREKGSLQFTAPNLEFIGLRRQHCDAEGIGLFTR